MEDSGEASIELLKKTAHKGVGKMKSKVLDKSNMTKVEKMQREEELER